MRDCRWYDFRAVTPTPDGGVVAVGIVIQNIDAKSDALVARFDGLGREHWFQLLREQGKGDGFETLQVVRASPTGELVFGGGWPAVNASGDIQPTTKRWLQRADAFGNSDCQSSGVCLQQSATACDDGDVCTADTCVAALNKGCAHAAFANQTPCGGNKVCFDAQCK